MVAQPQPLQQRAMRARGNQIGAMYQQHGRAADVGCCKMLQVMRLGVFRHTHGRVDQRDACVHTHQRRQGRCIEQLVHGLERGIGGDFQKGGCVTWGVLQGVGCSGGVLCGR